MQTSKLADESFAKMLRLNICKHIHVHNTFLLKYNNNK